MPSRLTELSYYLLHLMSPDIYLHKERGCCVINAMMNAGNYHWKIFVASLSLRKTLHLLTA